MKKVTVRLSSGKGVYKYRPGYRGSWKVTSIYAGATTATTVYRSRTASKRFRVR